jgi:hypothetical protein
MNIPKIIYYYQTFKTIQPIIKNSFVTHIHLSSIHFGTNQDKSPYIHLNDYPPNDEKFDTVWKEIEEAKDNGIKIILMMGGAGGAYTDLFSNFETYYSLLKKLLEEKKDIISGIDLDIEEYVKLEDVKMLINRIVEDFGEDFIISMAPVQESLQKDNISMGGFVYKDLYNSEVGKYIDYFNGQFYADYSEEAYNECIKNGYPPEKVVMGMITFENLQDNLKVLKNLYNKYGNTFGGSFIWEYSNSPPSWSIQVHRSLSNIFIHYLELMRYVIMI